MPPLLEVEQFTVRRVGGWSVHVPRLALAGGAVAALHGPSGCGKSTVLRALFGVLDGDAEASGAVRWRGEDISASKPAAQRHLLRHYVAFLMQDAQSALDPLLPVGRQITQATERGDEAAANMLTRLGVDDAVSLGKRRPHEISGGQAQCVLLAIAFLRSPCLVVADEPSASLDGDNYHEQLAHLRTLVAGGSAVLLATHDDRLLRDLQAQVLSIQGGSFLPGMPLSPMWPRRTGGTEIGGVSVLAAKAVTVASGAVTILRDVDFDLHRGEIVSIVGASGAGKTTLGRVLAGHCRPAAGAVMAPARRSAVQLVCQDAFGSMTPGRSIRSLVAEANSPFVDLVAIAKSLQLDDAVLDRAAAALSSGERRRAALLRAIAVQPDVLVLDEPMAGLDRNVALAVIEMLLTLQRHHGMAIVMITHDLDLAHAIADRVLTVRGGRLCES